MTKETINYTNALKAVIQHLEEARTHDRALQTLRALPEHLRAQEARIAALTKDAEPVAHIYPWDLERFKTQETHCTVFSVAVGCADGKSVPLYPHPAAPKKCTYTLCVDDSPTPDTLESSCDGHVLWYLGDDGKGIPPKFCSHCGGTVETLLVEVKKP